MRCGIIVDNELNNDVRVLREIKILNEQGFEIFVLCFSFHQIYSDLFNGIHVTRINISRKLKDILFFFLNSVPAYEWMWADRIKMFIKRNDLDMLHVHDLYMAKAASKGIKRSKKKIPMILDLHENYPFTITTYNWTKGFLRALISRPQAWQIKEKQYLLYADRIIVLSSDYRDLLIARYPELKFENFTVLPNVPELTSELHRTGTKLNLPFPNEFPVVLYYGVIAERRGIFDTLDVFTELVKENQGVNLLLIGPLDKKDKSRFFNVTGQELFTGRIFYIPWINSSELYDYMELIDICIAPFHKNPQHESGVANKIYEYMLGSKPIIASDCIPQQALIEKHDCGLVFSSLSEFKEEIIKLAGDKDLRIRLGKNGHDAVINFYNSEIVKEHLISLYRTLTS